MSKVRVLFLTNVPSPYRVDFFNKMGEQCDLTVLYQKEKSSERDEKWVGQSKNTYKSIFLKGISSGVDNAFSLEVLKYLKKKSFDVIFICGLASPTEMLALRWCKFRRISYYFESDGGVAKTGKGLKEYLKRTNLSGASGYLSTGQMHDAYYQFYGVPREKIIRYPFSSISDCEILADPLTREEKRKLREFNGFNSKYMAITVGQFIYRKGFDLLLKAWRKINPVCDLLIIGGEPTNEYVELSKQSSGRINFIPFMSKDQLKEYYKMADLFVFPTREDIWGLVVNEAMAMGLPVISTNRSGAAVELIENGNNGFIVNGEDVEALEIGIEKYISLSDEKKMEMAKAALKTAHEYTIEKMVERHMQICEE